MLSKHTTVSCNPRPHAVQFKWLAFASAHLAGRKFEHFDQVPEVPVGGTAHTSPGGSGRKAWKGQKDAETMTSLNSLGREAVGKTASPAALI